jgi:conflict system STAND superfamily ATPase
LKALSQADANLLCGRQDIVNEIVANCQAERLTVVSSEPGLGVTSLLQAGLAPALLLEGAVVAVFSDWQGRFFVSNLREAVAKAVREYADPQFYGQGEPLDDLLAAVVRRINKPVVILLDQFEDYIRCHSNSELSDSFDAELAHAVASRKGIFVIGLQNHAIPAFERLRQYIPNLLGFQVQLRPITIEAAKQATLAEARRIGVEADPAALESIVSAPVMLADGHPADGNAILPFFLKVAVGVLLDSEAAVKSSHLRMATIEARDGVDRVVMESLDAKIAELGTTHADLLFRWCQLLISPDRHRLSVTEKGLTDYAGKRNRFVPTLLPKLLENGILRSVDAGGVLRYELARECVAPILRDWWERREAVIVARRRAAFRIRSLSVAAGAIILTYVIWLIWGK